MAIVRLDFVTVPMPTGIAGCESATLRYSTCGCAPVRRKRTSTLLQMDGTVEGGGGEAITKWKSILLQLERLLLGNGLLLVSRPSRPTGQNVR